MEKTEIEVRFLEIDKKNFIKKLKKLDAKDEGEFLLEETIIYDKELKMSDEKRFIRLRKWGKTTILTYKENKTQTIDGAKEIEFEVSDSKQAEALLEKIGFPPFRRQQKYRHTFKFEDVTLDIDTWPRIPTYVEIEGPTKESVKKAAEKLGFDWKDAVFDDAKLVIENRYKIPVGKMRWFTFDRFE